MVHNRDKCDAEWLTIAVHNRDKCDAEWLIIAVHNRDKCDAGSIDKCEKIVRLLSTPAQ